jgi:isoleucyl-tRNA synthetase
LNDKKVNAAVVDLFAREGADAWYLRDIAEILPAGTKCAKCGGSGFRKEMDIIDVWFESGSSWADVMPKLRPQDETADLYTEGGDQHRGWFHSSLLCAVGTRNHAPYRAVATSGWTLDPQGRAMSKSLGNVVDPVDIAKRLGGEIVRLWVASVDFREDVTCSEELMQRVADNYRKVRNTFRNMLANLYDFTPADAVPFTQMQPLDQYMLVRTAQLTEQVKLWYEEFEFHRVYHAVHNFCAVDLSAIYFDVLKDRLYTFAPNLSARRSAQTAIWHIAESLVRLVAPLMSFTADEVWQFLPKVSGRPESVHLELFPSSKEIFGSEPAADALKKIEADWVSLMSVRDEALKALEAARQAKTIGSALESVVVLKADDPLYSLLRGRETEIRALLIVSGVEVHKAESGNGSGAVTVEVRRAPGEKCERCWNYSIHVGENKEFPTICERCSEALAEIVGAR